MTMWAYWVPLRYTPKMVTVVNFIMCILLQFKKKKDKLTREGRTGEGSSNRILEAGHLISSWQVWESSITSRQWRKQSTSPFPTQNPAETREMLLLDGRVGLTAGDGAGAVWEAADLPTAPLPCCWVLLGDCHPVPQNSGESFSAEQKSGDSAFYVIWADKSKDQKILPPGLTTNSPAKGLMARSVLMRPFHPLRALNLPCELHHAQTTTDSKMWEECL